MAYVRPLVLPSAPRPPMRSHPPPEMRLDRRLREGADCLHHAVLARLDAATGRVSAGHRPEPAHRHSDLRYRLLRVPAPWRPCPPHPAPPTNHPAQTRRLPLIWVSA